MTKTELNKLKKAELIELVASQESEIEDLRFDLEAAEEGFGDVSAELNEAQFALDELESISRSKEGIAESAFNAGFESCILGSEQLKGWLNYRIEAEL